MRLYRDQWRVPGIVPKMPPIDEERRKCRAWIVGLRCVSPEGANAPYIVVDLTQQVFDQERECREPGLGANPISIAFGSADISCYRFGGILQAISLSIK
ncbi:MAG: hypothetical protein GY862_05575 [Gammaproteobacteria bacterium]|nr:hypothetical protein [Gammaproteobacteria bacterium]